MAGLRLDSLTVKKRFFRKQIVMLDDQLLSACGFHAGSDVDVWVE